MSFLPTTCELCPPSYGWCETHQRCRKHCDCVDVKVHVTPKQREYLEFLVNRRLSDIAFKIGYADMHRPGRELTEEEKQLRDLKLELQQAGT